MNYLTAIVENGQSSEHIIQVTDTNQHSLELIADTNEVSVDIIAQTENIIEIGIPYILPSGFGQFVTGGYGISTFYDSNINLLTISATGLQPAGNYSLVGHSHSINDILELQDALDGKQPSGNYALVNHTHTVSQITNFNAGVSGLLPGVSGSGYVNSSFSNNHYTISVTGLQPTGNYSVVGHTHTSSNITDFASAVSGLIPASNFTSLTGLSGVSVSTSGTNYYVSLTDPTIQLGDITDLSANARSFLLTPSSNNLQTLVTNETGSGLLVFNNSPALSGIPTAPTAPSGTNTSQIANTSFVRTEISNLINSAPSTLDTLNELAQALGNDPNFATTITNNLANKASLSGAIFTGSVTIPSGNGNFNNLTVNNINVSISGHNHQTSAITDFNSGVSGLLPNITGSAYINTTFNNNTYTISASGLQPSGNYANANHTHTTNDITNFNSGVSGLLPSVTGIGYVSSIFSNNIYTINVTGLQPSGNYANAIHTHVSSDITDFNSSVSGLLPVKDIIAGTGIGVVSVSGSYTINSTSTLSQDTLEPDGFVNRTDNILSFDDNSRQFSIGPKTPATSYSIYNNGTKVIKSSIETITLPDTTALYFIHFDKSNSSLSYKTTGFDFETDIPIAHIYYNADDNKAVYFGEERHGIRMDSSTHKYLHNVFGTQYINGLSISNYTLSGNGSSNSDATISISNGLIYDEDIDAAITHSNTPSNPFEQVLYPIAQIPIYYKVGSSGIWTNTIANNYPVKTGTTIQYNFNNGGIWSASDSDNPNNNRYIAYWICATTQENAPIISIMGQRIDSSLIQSQSNNSWSNLNLTGLPIIELRPLYRLIYDTKSTFSNSPKGFLTDILDIRSHVDTITGLTQNDHGNLYGLADDDHYQYVHLDNARTIDAIHTFSHGLISSGLISSTSGNFNNLTVNSIDVSLSGHNHTSSNISDFNSSVSGLLPTISGSGYVNSIFNNNSYTISVSGLQPSGNYSVVGHTHSSADITDFNSSVSGLLPSVSGSGYITSNFSNNIYTINITGVQPSGNYANSTHSHSSSDITDFNSSVSGLLPSISGSGYVVSNLSNNLYTISVTGLQPSGNYANASHTHTASNITDFSSSVSGLLPVTNILGGTNINVTPSGSSYTISVSGSLGLTTEEVDDRVSNLLVAGSGINLNYNDVGNSLTISVLNNKILSDTVSSTNYIGIAPYGSATSSSVWTIYKTVYTSGGAVSSNTTATNVKWDDRLTATYV